jgi:hypothetical protein
MKIAELNVENKSVKNKFAVPNTTLRKRGAGKSRV